MRAVFSLAHKPNIAAVRHHHYHAPSPPTQTPQSKHLPPPAHPIEPNPTSKQRFYREALGNGAPELLPSLCSRGVTYADARGAGCDAFGRAGVAEVIRGICSAHPVWRVELDGVAVDASGARAVAEWRATAAHLLPGAAGAAPTGLVSLIVGCDQITFGDDGLISSILSFRDRFAEEEEAAAVAEQGQRPEGFDA